MVPITYSYTTATLLESTGIYNYAHNEVKVISAVVKSIRDPTISQDVTQMMKHFISTQKMSDSVSMKSFTVDSSRLIDYTGCDIDPGHQKKMEIKLAYSDCVLFMNDIDVTKNDKNVNNSIILEKTGNYYFSAACLDVVKAVVRSVNNNCIAHDVTCALDKEVYMFQGMRYIKIDSSLFNTYTGCDIDSCSKKYLDITLSNDFHHPLKPCHPCDPCATPCTTTCPPEPCTTTCATTCPVPSNGYPTYSSYIDPTTCATPCVTTCPPQPCTTTCPTSGVIITTTSSVIPSTTPVITSTTHCSIYPLICNSRYLENLGYCVKEE
jgi:hypothetical protein